MLLYNHRDNGLGFLVDNTILCRRLLILRPLLLKMVIKSFDYVEPNISSQINNKL